MLIGSFLLRGIKTFGGINMLNYAEMKMLTKFCFSSLQKAVNIHTVKSAHDTSTASVSEGKGPILIDLFLQEFIDLSHVFPHSFSSLLTSAFRKQLGFPFASNKNNASEI